MGLFDTILGRTKPAKPDLDELFALPSAAVTLQAAGNLRPTGSGSVCVKKAEGGAFAGLQEQIEQLLAVDADDGSQQVRRDHRLVRLQLADPPHLAG